MERSRLRRPGIQKTSQITKNTFEDRTPVAKVSSVVPNIPNTALLARRQPIDMSLPGEVENLRIHELFKKNKWRRYRRNSRRVMAISLVLLLTLGGLIFSQAYLRMHQVFRGAAPAASALKITKNPNLLNGESNGQINVLILGRSGGNGPKSDITDTMMLASIDPIDHSVNLISVPENLWVTFQEGGAGKISNAFENGEFQSLDAKQTGSTSTAVIDNGFKFADQSVGQVLGLNIDYNVIINYQAFGQLVDGLGGININVPTTLVDPTIAWENNNNSTILAAGPQTITGKQALLYVRSVETTNVDSRATRQRLVLQGIFDKFLTVNTLMNPLKISQTLSTFSSNVTTDLTINNAYRLFNILKNINPNNINNIDFNSTTNNLLTSGNEVGQAIQLPTAGLLNYSAIHKYITSQFGNPFIKEDNAKIEILNGTNVSGLATQLTTKISNLGFSTLPPGNTPSAGWSHTTLVSLNKNDTYTKNYLAKILNVKPTNKLPNNTIPTNGADFVIIIGNDEANISQN